MISSASKIPAESLSAGLLRKTVRCLSLGLLTGFVFAASAGHSQAEMAAADGYVVTPNELKKEFTSKHPGAEWLVAHDDVFKLSPQQKQALEGIGTALDEKKKGDSQSVSEAFKTFTAAAAKHPPDAKSIDQSIERLSQAQIQATRTVVEANIAAFAVLNPKQKIQFEDLVRCCAPPP